MKVLLYGSTRMTEEVASFLWMEGHTIVGFVPCHKDPTVPGHMTAPKCLGPDLPEHDLALSVQYDRILEPTPKLWNLHTGLLPDWGGCDILYHTLKAEALEQGLTFHKITEGLDAGPVLARTRYPVWPTVDTIPVLYGRMLDMIGPFAVWCVNTIDDHKGNPPLRLPSAPTLYKRGRIAEEDREEYVKVRAILRRRFG